MSGSALRIVSLVPSATETLVALGVVPIACTRFCEQPDIAPVGGTKDPHVDEIVALAPDLVVMNNEENRLEDSAALQAAGLEVHSMSPSNVIDVGRAVRDLALRIGAPVPPEFEASAWDALVRRTRAGYHGRIAVMIWRRPWMTIMSDTYAASVLLTLGWTNCVSGTEERYPELTLEQIRDFEPAAVLLPNEPYPFAERHVAEVEAAMPAARVLLVDGQDLFWWGIRTPAALDHLSRNDW